MRNLDWAGGNYRYHGVAHGYVFQCTASSNSRGQRDPCTDKEQRSTPGTWKLGLFSYLQGSAVPKLRAVRSYNSQWLLYVRPLWGICEKDVPLVSRQRRSREELLCVALSSAWHTFRRVYFDVQTNRRTYRVCIVNPWLSMMVNMLCICMYNCQFISRARIKTHKAMPQEMIFFFGWFLY